MQGDRAFAAVLGMECHQGAQIEVREHVPVDHHEALSDTAMMGGKSYGTRRVQRFRFDCVMDLHPCANAIRIRVDKSIGPVSHGQHRFGDPMRTQVLEHMLDHGFVEDRQHLLWRGHGERPKPGPKAANQNDGLHPPVPGSVVAVAPPEVAQAAGGFSPSQAPRVLTCEAVEGAGISVVPFGTKATVKAP